MTQVGLMRAVQSVSSPVLDVLFGAITMLGAEEAFILMIALLFWTVSKMFAIRVGVLVLLSSFVNSGLKDLFRLPRPSPDEVRVILAETGGGYGFPSAHAQTATVFWGYLARAVRPRRFTVAAVAIVFLIGLSRVYLGVHFPGDVVGGFVFGGVILAVYLWVTEWLAPPGRALPKPWLPPVAVLAPFGLLALYRSAEAFKMVGLLVGLGTGCLVEDRYVRMDERASLGVQVLKATFGIAVTFGLRAGLKALFAPESAVLGMVRYAAMALWVSLGAPAVFVLAFRPSRKA